MKIIMIKLSNNIPTSVHKWCRTTDALSYRSPK